MFKALQPLLAQCKSLNITLLATGENRVAAIVMPVPKDGQSDPSLRTPIKLEGTTQELDDGFENAVSRIAHSRSGLVESVELATAAIDAAKKATDAKTAKAVHGKGKTLALPAPKPASAAAASNGGIEDDESHLDDGGDAGDEENPMQPALTTSAGPTLKEKDPMGDLFGG